jgi:hypothetical protein
MASFKTQIQDVIGSFDDDVAINQFLTDGAKELINMMPPLFKEKCTAETTLNNSSTTMDMDGVGEILYVNRLSADSGGSRIPCRKVPSMYGELSNDSNSLHKASVTDPVYWILSSSDVSILNVIPTPTANQTAIVYHVAYPTIVGSDDSVVANFPDELEYLVVLYAAIKVAERQLIEEEDVELYIPIIATLKQDYMQGLQNSGLVQTPVQGAK